MTLRTGKTQRMLEDVLKEPAREVVVFAHSHPFAMELCGRMADLAPDAERTRDAIVFPGGKVVRFLSAFSESDYLRKLIGIHHDAAIYKDHYVFEHWLKNIR